MNTKVNKWSFAALCNLTRKNLNRVAYLGDRYITNTQENVIYMLYFIGSGDGRYIDGRGTGYFSKIFNATYKVSDYYINDISLPENETLCTERIKKILQKNIVNRETFFLALSKRIYEISDLASYKGLDFSSADIDEQAKFLLECIRSAVSIPNNFNLIKINKQRKEMIIKYNSETDDPFGLATERSESSAINIIIKGDDLKNEPYNIKSGQKLFHHFETCLDFIINEKFLILDVKETTKTVEIVISKTEYSLKRLEMKNYSEALNLLLPSIKDFQPKRSWKGKNIVQLAENGFKEGIWIPYGFYDNNTLIAVCDYKIRLDKNIELGIICVNSDYRQEQLGKSLLYYFRLKFFALKLFSGTYHTNENMIKTFKSAGFKPLIFTKNAEGIEKGTNIIYDRVDESIYSVYFITEPLWDTQKHFVCTK